MILTRVGKRKDARGRPITTYGYRFIHRGELYKKFTGTSRALAVEAEKRERARAELAAWEGQYGPLRPRLTPIPKAVEDFLAAKAGKPVAETYRQQLAWWTSFFASKDVHHLQAITPELLDKGKAALLAIPRDLVTVEHYFAALRALLRMAVRRWRVLRESPMTVVDWPRPAEKIRRTPTVEEYQKLLDLAARTDPGLVPLLVAAVHTGLRKHSVLRLTAEDFRQRSGWILGEDEKGKRRIWLPVTKTLAETVKTLGVVSGRLFRAPDGTPTVRLPEKRWRALRVSAGMPWCTWHDLRHCTGTILAEAGVPQRVIQDFLGHKTGRITERYTRPTEQGLQEAGVQLDRALRTKKPTKKR